LAKVVVGIFDDGDVETEVIDVAVIAVDGGVELGKLLTTVVETIEVGSGWIASFG
jgi:hypothetical protein